MSLALFCYVVLATVTAGSIVVSFPEPPFKWSIYVFYGYYAVVDDDVADDKKSNYCFAS
jgi:hypothetical protein